MMLVIDDSDRPWDTALSRDEPLPLQPLDHLVHGGGRHEEVPPDIRFSWGDTEPKYVPCDELKVVPLTAGGLGTVVESVPGRVAGAASQSCSKAAVEQLDAEDGVVGEMNLESSSVRLRDVRHRLSRDLVRDVRHVSARPSHGNCPTSHIRD
jgi:hypothetical protein